MTVIDFLHVTKQYQLGAYRNSLRDALAQLPRQFISRKESGDDHLFKALDDVSFQIEQGDVVGFIGRNGAGKSTILKLLSKVTFPTSGIIRTKGRIAALIELGAGFHPDLSGRENVYLNGAVLGLKKKEIDTQFSNIVEFAGLEQFIDTPIKRYSSGMYVRLAFAVAAHVKADLLLIDEVLSVGDMSFQQKSMAKMAELRRSGSTIVFVSHNLAAVQSFCERVLLMDGGKIAYEGSPSQAIETYRNLEKQARLLALEKIKKENRSSSNSLDLALDHFEAPHLRLIELLNIEGKNTDELDRDEPVTVRCHFQIPTQIDNPVCMVRVRRRADHFTCFTAYRSINDRTVVCGNGYFDMSFGKWQLASGAYILEVNIHNYQNWEDGAFADPQFFIIRGDLSDEEGGVYVPTITGTDFVKLND